MGVFGFREAEGRASAIRIQKKKSPERDSLTKGLIFILILPSTSPRPTLDQQAQP